MVEHLGKHWEREQEWLLIKSIYLSVWLVKRTAGREKGYRKKTQILLHTSNYMQTIIESRDRKYV